MAGSRWWRDPVTPAGCCLRSCWAKGRGVRVAATAAASAVGGDAGRLRTPEDYWVVRSTPWL